MKSKTSTSNKISGASFFNDDALSKSRLVVLLSTILFLNSSAGMALASSDASWNELQHSATNALDANKYWLAEPLLKKSVTEAEKFGFGDLRLATSLSELGRLYTIRGRFSEAEPFLERELAVREMAIGKDDGKLIPSMGSLVRFYLTYGTLSKAQPLTDEILDFVEGKMKEPIVQKSEFRPVKMVGAPIEGWCGTAAPVMRTPIMEWAVTCDAIGNAYRERGNFDVAERLFKAALDIKATILGEGHLSLANSYDNLGGLCLAKNDMKEAESYFRDSLATTEKTLPPESAEVYSRLDKLAKCLIKSGKYEQAEALYLKALTFWKGGPSKYGNDCRAYFALGSLYAEEKKYSQAEPMLKHALHLAERFNGPYQIGLVPYLQRYAYVLYYLNRRDEAAHLRARADAIIGPQT